MIKGIAQGSYIRVERGFPTMPAFYGNIVGKELVGQVKYSTSSQNLEVWDGATWQPIIGAYPTISLDPMADRAIAWIIKKMIQEEELTSHKHPAMIAAYENFQKARQQLEATAILIKEDYNNEQPTS